MIGIFLHPDPIVPAKDDIITRIGGNTGGWLSHFFQNYPEGDLSQLA